MLRLEADRVWLQDQEHSSAPKNTHKTEIINKTDNE